MSECRLDEICNIYDCPHYTAENEGKGYALIRTPNVGRGRLIMSDVHRVSFENYKKRNARATPECGDLIFAREAPVGNIAVIQNGEAVCLGQRTVLLKPNPKIVNAYYLAYNILTPWQQRRLLAPSAGSIVSHVNLKDIKAFTLTLPTIEQQKIIAQVLCALDDKIELNRRLNDNLEAMAQALYDYWFVQFDFPDENGKPYKSSGGKMVWNEVLKREIPDGWEVCAIKDILNPQKAPFRLDAKQYKQAGLYPIFDQATDNYIAGYTDNPDVLQNTYPAVIFGDHSCTVKLAPSPYARGADGTQVMTTSHPNLPVYYFYRYIKSTKVPNPGYSRHFKFLKSSFIIIPDNEIVARFNAAVGCIEEKVWILHQERQNLSIHRDFLLPLLMNGQVQVKPLNYRLTAD